MCGSFRASRIALLLAVALVAGACNYGLRGGGGFPPHVRTIFIAPLDNETVQFDVDQQIFRVMAERLPRTLGVRVAGERTADAIIRGRVTRYEDVAQSYLPGQGTVDVLAHQVQITLNLQIIDVQRNEIIFEGAALTGRGTYNPSTQSEEVARATAIDALIQAIIDGAQSQW
jgi:curli biogenesis system outer membrane secretion channel CsgG